MKVLMLNGSPHPNGCVNRALEEITKVLKNENIDTEIVNLPTTPIRDCIACMKCKENTDNLCIFNDDIVNLIIEKAKTSDAFVFATPVYYAHASGRILSVLDRAFFAGSSAFSHKPSASVASARRAGTVCSVDELNKYFMINEMPIVSSTYWNNVHGMSAEDVEKDLEGLQTMRNLAQNMAWLLKCIQAGKSAGIVCPTADSEHRTNFIE